MSEAAATSPDVSSVLAALQALYHNPDAQAKQQANQALLQFQKTPQAWSTANTLLLAQDVPLESRLFSAQTFRSKVTFDLEQLEARRKSSCVIRFCMRSTCTRQDRA